ncbi:DNA-processing protein DprA [Acidisoma sp.]|uniref:DNA-processing protein DprA n=1 Tax=Acidisoma sp. TaxID=1872115 RepID=UPI003B00EE54
MSRTGSDLADRLRLARTEGVGPVTYRRLLDRYKTPAAALEALPGLARAAGRPDKPIPSLAMIEDEIAGTERLGGQFLMPHMPSYPPLLALLPDPPPALAVLGSVDRLADRSVAIVGGRNASLNGQRLAAHMSAALGGEGITVVSGMARGIDAAAHEAVLAAGGCTVAAVAGGLDHPYPPQHVDLQARIAVSGAVVTEAPLGTEPQARHFPRRNRIIAGLALGVVVVEAACHSGSLITARLALEAGREVFAVPGSPLDPRCQGSNDLIRQGAQLTETIGDILAHLPRGPEDFTANRRPPQLFDHLAEELPMSPFEASEIRASVLQLLSPAPTSVDDLLRHCQFTSQAALLAALLDLELGGVIESLPGNRVALIAQQQGG